MIRGLVWVLNYTKQNISCNLFSLFFVLFCMSALLIFSFWWVHNCYLYVVLVQALVRLDVSRVRHMSASDTTLSLLITLNYVIFFQIIISVSIMLSVCILDFPMLSIFKILIIVLLGTHVFSFLNIKLMYEYLQFLMKIHL
jgi:hypothetical protein